MDFISNLAICSCIVSRYLSSYSLDLESHLLKFRFMLVSAPGCIIISLVISLSPEELCHTYA